MLVQLRGYATESAFTGPRRSRKIRDHVPDVVFLDLMLPDMDGYEVCRALKTSGRPSGPGRHRHGPARRREPDRELRRRGRRLCPQAVHARPDLRGPGTVRSQASMTGDAPARRRSRARRPGRRRDAPASRPAPRLVAGRSGLEPDAIDRISAAIRAIWSSVDAWSRRSGLERVATLAYAVSPENLVLTVHDEAGWLSSVGDLAGGPCRRS